MQTQLSNQLLATTQGQSANEILRKCVHCGFCNATCPTYQLLGDELDGPRGRIYLVKELLEGRGDLELTKFHLDRCLTCKSCETTCPSGVEYSHLAEIGREQVAKQEKRKTLFEKLTLYLVPRPELFRLLVLIGRCFRWFAPSRFRRTLKFKPTRKAVLRKTEHEIVLLQGCVQRAMTPNVVAHLANLLEQHNIGVRVNDSELCCGGLHFHLGEVESSKTKMTDYMASLGSLRTTAYISSATGCAAVLKDYGRILGTENAQQFSERVQDVSVLLDQLNLTRAAEYEKIAFHAPCSLQHGLHLDHLPRRILQRAGYELVSTKDDHICCGSAGTYSLFQPELSSQLLNKKIDDLSMNAPDAIATANIGCQLHLASQTSKPVVHWVTLLK